MKTYILKFICVFLISTLAFLLSACNVSNGYKPTADATWGDLCNQFEPKWYASLSDEVRTQLDNLLLSENHASNNDDSSISATVPVYKEIKHTNDAGYTVFGQDNGDCTSEENISNPVGISLMINEQDKSIDYISSVYSSISKSSTDIAVIIALSDTKSREYLAIDADIVSITNDIDGIVDGFKNLKHNHKYTVQAIAIIEPPEGYSSSCPLYVEKAVTTIEPISTTT